MEDNIFVKNNEMTSRKYLKGTIIEPDITLNEVASVFYENVNGKTNFEGHIELLMNEFDVDYETCKSDLLKISEELLDKQVIMVK